MTAHVHAYVHCLCQYLCVQYGLDTSPVPIYSISCDSVLALRSVRSPPPLLQDFLVVCYISLICSPFFFRHSFHSQSSRLPHHLQRRIQTTHSIHVTLAYMHTYSLKIILYMDIWWLICYPHTHHSYI